MLIDVADRRGGSGADGFDEHVLGQVQFLGGDHQIETVGQLDSTAAGANHFELGVGAEIGSGQDQIINRIGSDKDTSQIGSGGDGTVLFYELDFTVFEDDQISAKDEEQLTNYLLGTLPLRDGGSASAACRNIFWILRV